MRRLALALLTTAMLTGCGATPTAAGMSAQAQPQSARAIHDAPIAELDCNRDWLVSPAELAAGFLINNAPVSAETFADYDLSRDGQWSRSEFVRFLARRNAGAWRVLRTCN